MPVVEVLCGAAFWIGFRDSAVWLPPPAGEGWGGGSGAQNQRGFYAKFPPP